MPFDYKKEYKEYYQPPKKPGIVTVPPMNFVAVRGKGDPNDPAGEYQQALELLYGLAYTIKMSYKGSHKMAGFFEYVVPPLEGLWWQADVDGVDYASKVRLFSYNEGLCVQCMHVGSYDAEPETLRQMDEYAAAQGYAVDFSKERFHHEIYLGDPRKTAPEKLKTVLRHPIRAV